jgi:hypothetical protein
VLKLDLKDFFPSVTFARVRGLLIAYGYSYPVATSLAVVMTEAERQPVEVEGETFHVPVGLRHCVQGAPTSPGLCNALVLRLDRRLAGLARKHRLAFTRYADDLTFSGDVSRDVVWRVRMRAETIIKEEGFALNPDKTHVQGQGGRQTVTGVVVNRVLGLSRQDRRRLRAALHQLGKTEGPDRAADAQRASHRGPEFLTSQLAPRARMSLRPADRGLPLEPGHFRLRIRQPLSLPLSSPSWLPSSPPCTNRGAAADKGPDQGINLGSWIVALQRGHRCPNSRRRPQAPRQNSTGRDKIGPSRTLQPALPISGQARG